MPEIPKTQQFILRKTTISIWMRFRFYKIYKYEEWHDEKLVNKILFPIHWDRAFKEQMSWDKPVTTGYAIHEVEKFFNKKLTQKYIDAYAHLKKYREFFGNYKIRGDILEGYFWLESLKFKNGILELDYCN